jgi:hypothetical protein
MRGARLVMAAVAVSAVLVAGCGGNGGKPAASSSSPSPSVAWSILDTGSYSKLPRKLGPVASEEEGRMAEAQRMSEAVADPSTLDPSLVVETDRGPLISPSDVARDIALNQNPVIEPVLKKYGMICAHFALARSEKIRSAPGAPAVDLKTIVIMLVRFPDEAAAGNAAVEMDAVDFAVSPQNVPVPITKYPQAHGHWRPSHPSMASTLAHGPFVIQVEAQNPTPNLQTLTDMVEKTFDAEIALLDRFQPTPVNQIGTLPRDPDKLLGRLVDLTPGTEPSLSLRFGSLGANGASSLQNERERKDRVYEKAGVDLIAYWAVDKQGFADIVRARDRDAASTLMDQDISGDSEKHDHPIDGPQGLPDAKCFERKKDAYKDDLSGRFACYLRYDRYEAYVVSGDATDVRQRAAAQYALLVNPL